MSKTRIVDQQLLDKLDQLNETGLTALVTSFRGFGPQANEVFTEVLERARDPRRAAAVYLAEAPNQARALRPCSKRVGGARRRTFAPG